MRESRAVREREGDNDRALRERTLTERERTRASEREGRHELCLIFSVLCSAALHLSEYSLCWADQSQWSVECRTFSLLILYRSNDAFGTTRLHLQWTAQSLVSQFRSPVSHVFASGQHMFAANTRPQTTSHAPTKATSQPEFAATVGVSGVAFVDGADDRTGATNAPQLLPDSALQAEDPGARLPVQDSVELVLLRLVQLVLHTGLGQREPAVHVVRLLSAPTLPLDNSAAQVSGLYTSSQTQESADRCQVPVPDRNGVTSGDQWSDVNGGHQSVVSHGSVRPPLHC